MTYDEEYDGDEDDDGDEDGGYYWRRGFAGLRAIGIYRPVASWVSPRFVLLLFSSFAGIFGFPGGGSSLPGSPKISIV